MFSRLTTAGAGRKRGLLLAIATVVVLLGVVVPAAPASAANLGKNCGEGESPLNFDANQVKTFTTATHLGRKIEVRYFANQVQVNVWGRITNAKPGDRVWFDMRAVDDRADWYQCGPFSVSGNSRFTDAASVEGKRGALQTEREFRVCGDVPNNGHKCTAWVSPYYNAG